ncbi:hypothetical protein PLEI_0233 [Photobacterium leiognathi lrivu.4.1]|uniref:Uncharacterized protein n=1 Tax=Photobacterium leiognathi lrivu.4.1 TaxID=1248232 RepID=V5F6X6_PHOLE|nr:hypothetical protein PLEI_0233 [Photobacterium leiognathi lrivu.4.1]
MASSMADMSKPWARQNRLVITATGFSSEKPVPRNVLDQILIHIVLT